VCASAQTRQQRRRILGPIAIGEPRDASEAVLCKSASSFATGAFIRETRLSYDKISSRVVSKGRYSCIASAFSCCNAT
jgi:hypothetical protein